MDKVILITGASRGIGAATARLAARQGYRICINYHADDAAAQQVLEQVRDLGAEAIAVRADASVEDEVVQLFQRIDHELGLLTALVNNAGTIAQQSRVEDMSEFRLLKMMKTNVVGPMLCAKHALRRMSRRHGGQAAVSSTSPRWPRAWARLPSTWTMPRPRARWIPLRWDYPRRSPARACASMPYVPATFTPAFMP